MKGALIGGEGVGRGRGGHWQLGLGGTNPPARSLGPRLGSE